MPLLPQSVAAFRAIADVVVAPATAIITVVVAVAIAVIPIIVRHGTHTKDLVWVLRRKIPHMSVRVVSVRKLPWLIKN